MNFTDPSYLQHGNVQQQSAYRVLTELHIFSSLAEFQPVLTGTFPLGINAPGSDLDISCAVYDPKRFVTLATNEYGKLPRFQVKQAIFSNLLTVLIRFNYQRWPIELFGQALPSLRQSAYRHMVAEHRILQLANPSFFQRVKELKSKGIVRHEVV